MDSPLADLQSRLRRLRPAPPYAISIHVTICRGTEAIFLEPDDPGKVLLVSEATQVRRLNHDECRPHAYEQFKEQ